MSKGRRARLLRQLLSTATLITGCAAASFAHAQSALLPTGQTITPTAAPGAVFQALNPGLADQPQYTVGQTVKTVISPDGKTMLVLTSGYNNLNYASNPASPDYGYLEPQDSNEYVFVYDISGMHAASPLVKQVIQIPDTYVGMVFSPDGSKFYASGGVDDVVYGYTNGASGWSLTSTISLNHVSLIEQGLPLAGGNGFYQSPLAANLAITADGNTLVTANTYNDSISLINLQTGTTTLEYDLRPFNTTPATGTGVAGGERPFGIAVAPNGNVYVSSLRDREVVVLNISSGTPQFVARIPLSGSPNNMLFDNAANPTKLYVAQDNSDYVAVINLADNTVGEQIDAIGPAGITNATERYTGAASNNLALTADGKTLLVSNGAQNAVSVISLAGPAPHSSIGLIPTGWYPQAVSVSRNGGYIYIANSKSAAGPNVNHLTGSTYALQGTQYPGGNAAAGNAAYASNQYVFQIEHAGLLAIPTPSSATLATLTQQVAANNAYNVPESPSSLQTMQALAAKIKHVIYIVKENRTFDQVLGDLKNGSNGQPSLTVFGKRVTPNFHVAANSFVTLDNFYDPAEVSGNGWPWSTAARETDKTVKDLPMDYAYAPISSVINQFGYSRGAPYDSEGTNSDVDVGIATTAGRTVAQPEYPLLTSYLPGGTANLLPGTNNDAAPDGPNGAEQTGYMWDSALRAGLTIRNYGFFIDLGGAYANVSNPYQLGDIEAYSTNPTLINYTDPYFRSFDNNYPDYWRYLEWDREFTNYVTNNDLPQLTFLRYMHDHMGNFSTAVGGINYPEAQQADDDYAVGLTLQTLAHSKYASNTLVVIVEDDSQDGPDHVDEHRSTAYFVGPYVKHKAVVSTRYTTVNMIRTIEEILGMDHLNLNDANAQPMADVFDLNQKAWSFNAILSPYLNGTVDAPAGAHFSDTQPATPAHPASWWAQKTAGFDWSKEDRVPADRFNRIIWQGFRGNAPYPAAPGTGRRSAGDND